MIFSTKDLTNDIKNNIQMLLVNTKDIKDIDCISYEFHELSVIFALNNLEKIQKMCTVPFTLPEHCHYPLVNKSLLEYLRVTVKELIEIGFKNTSKLTPPTVNRLSDVVDGISSTSDNLSKHMYIISNINNKFGAINMLYKKILYGIASSYKQDLYILPSSVHEVITLPANYGKNFAKDKGIELKQYVIECNEGAGTTNTLDFLSNTVYYYDLEKNEVRVAD